MSAASEVLQQHLSCPAPIAQLLIARGVTTPEAADAFFNPSLAHLYDPHTMLGMEAAVRRIRHAVAHAESILICGDYDVDGTVATVLLKTAIERIAPASAHAQVSWHVPHRIREGYGIHTPVLAQGAAEGVRLVISVDTGIRAFAAAEEARALGLDLIVTDHHLPDEAEGIPHAIAILNPNQSGCHYPNKHLCGAGVALKLAHAILLAHAETFTPGEREAWHTRLNRALLPSFLKLVAIATIADSVPLEGENRAITALGLRELANPVQPGLRALLQVAKISSNCPPTSTEIAFRVAPRINAAGRMDIAGDVVELFLTRDGARAEALAEKLDTLNTARRDTEAQALATIDRQLDAMLAESGECPPHCIVLDDPAWHRGVLGILASRIVDRTNRPALVLTYEDGHAHGSGRSVSGFHLLDALTSIHEPAVCGTGSSDPLFTRFGGHAHAVGFSLPTQKVAVLRERMTSYGLRGSLTAPPLPCELELSFAELTSALYEWLARCGPFGTGNPEPVFITRNLTLTAPVRYIKEKHICLQLEGEAGIRISAPGWSNRAIDWRVRCTQLDLRPGCRIDAAYRLRRNSNPGFAALELELVDLCMASFTPET